MEECIINEISVFKNQDFGEVRTVNLSNEPWFVASDVCNILGVQNVTQAISTLEEDERSMFNIGRQGMANIISESGFYTLVLRSRKDVAKPFRLWVTREVIPQIRKTGGYIPIKEDDDDLDIMSKALLIAQKTLEKKNQIIANMEPLAAIAEERIDKKGCISITDATKSFNFKRGQISRWAKAQGYLHMNLTEVNKLGEKYFKVYSSDMIHNQIGITEEGIKLITDNKEEIMNTGLKVTSE